MVYGYKGKGVKIIMLIMIFVYFIGMLYKGIDYYSVGRYNPFIPYQFCFNERCIFVYRKSGLNYSIEHVFNTVESGLRKGECPC